MPATTNGTTAQFLPQTILVIEDDAAVRRLLIRELEQNGFRTVEAKNGVEALLRIFEHRPDLVLLDILLPGLFDGFEVLRRFRTDPRSAPIPVVVLSNLGQQADIERARELGAKEYFVKTDVDLAEVVVRIAKILGRNGESARA
jgi:CheY-like chemotaxis protein